MRRTYLQCFATGLLAILATNSIAEPIHMDWNSVQPRSATGDLDGLLITAAASDSSQFNSIVVGRFAGAEWETDAPLNEAADAIYVVDANPGDTHSFVFTETVEDIFFYIENFDLDAVATVTAEGASAISLMHNSQSISLAPLSSDSATLSTSNSTSNGEGDLVLKLEGELKSLSIDYTAGTGSNGVFYTFAQAVPEPSSGLSLLMGLLVIGTYRRRAKS